MNEDLKKFENRSDDWLADQINYESTISAWDLDEGRRIRVEHEKAHSVYNIKVQEAREQLARSVKPSNSTLNRPTIKPDNFTGNNAIIILPVAIVFVFTLILFMGVGGYGRSSVPLIMLLILLINAFSLSIKQRRK